MMSLPKIIGIVLHPILLAIPGVFLIVFSSTASINESLYWTFLSLIFSGFISLFVILGVKMKFFNNLDVSNRRQRVFLYPFAIAIILLFAFVVNMQNGPQSLITSSLLFTVALLVLDIINRKVKASIHVAAVSAIVTGVILMYGGFFYLLFLLIPISAWARIKQKRHTPTETIVGAICGVTLTILGIFVVQLLVS